MLHHTELPVVLDIQYQYILLLVFVSVNVDKNIIQIIIMEKPMFSRSVNSEFALNKKSFIR